MNADDDLAAAALLQWVLRHKQIDPETLQNLIAQQQAEYDAACAKLSATAYTIDPVARTLQVLTFPAHEVLASFDLYEGFGEGDPLQEEPWGMSLAGLKPEGILSERMPLSQSGPYGLILTPDQAYIYSPTLLEDAHWAQSNQYLYPRVPKGSGQTAYDLYLSENRSYLAITDRAAGTVRVLGTTTNQVLGLVQVRAPGSLKALNIAFDYYEPKVFITDQQSPTLHVLSLDTMALAPFELEPGNYQAFGNIVRSPDIRYLYVLVLKPAPVLYALNLETGEWDDQMSLRGSPFSNQHLDPCDLLMLTPDQNYLLLMTSFHDPTPLTPLISIIDPHQFEVVKQQTIPYALRDHAKPAGLVFPMPNPLKAQLRSPLELLVKAGLVTTAEIRALQAGEDPDAVTQTPEVVDLDDPEGPTHGQGPVPTLVPQSAESITLDPAQAVPAIIFALSQRLYQQTEMDLYAPVHAEEMPRFEEIAENYRQQLETHDAVDVALDNLLGRFRLAFYLTRQDVLSLMARGALESEGVVRPPQTCPACNQSLRGNWDCPSCFLELESPQRVAKKKQSSLDALGSLPRYQIIVPDPVRRRVVVLDDKKTIDFELRGPELPCPSPWNALVLPNKQFLIVDRDGNQVLECSPSGKVNWAYNAETQPDNGLLAPVKATYFFDESEEQFLIVDQGNHRVLIVNRKQRVVWEYGVKGEPGAESGHLSEPSDLQRTFDGTYLIADTGNHRVLEVRNQEIIRTFGVAQGLNTPVFAQRLYDHTTLVVDAGNYRLVEIAPDGAIVAEYFYFSADMGEDMRMDRPSRAFRREKKSVILMDEDKILEILLPKRRLVWSSLLKHLAQRVEILHNAFDKSESYVQSFHQYRMPTLEELIERLHKDERYESASERIQRIAEHLAALLEERRERDRLRAPKPQVQLLQTGQVFAATIYVIDRSHQQIVEINRLAEPLWYFGTDPTYKLLQPTHITEISDGLLIADTHHDRILEVVRDTQSVRQVWSGQLNQPRSAWRTLHGHILISDQGHKRLVELNETGEELWSYQTPREIAYPYFAMELGQGTILFVDRGLHMVKEITRSGELIWAYGQPSRMGNEENRLTSPEYAVRLHSGAILIADTGNHRILEVSPQRKILWAFSGTARYALHKPSYCQRLPNGHTLIAYNGYRCLLEVDREGEACWHFELGTEALVSRELRPY